MPLSDEDRWRRDITREWRRWCDQLVVLATTARDLGAEIVIAAALESTIVNGFSSSASGTGDGASPGSHGDPTGNRVVGQLEHKIVLVSNTMKENLAAAFKALEAADRQITRGRHILKPPAPPGRAEAPECVNCSRFEIYTPAVRAGRCEECADYRRDHGRDANEQTVKARPANAVPRELARKAAIPAESAQWMATAIDRLRGPNS